ncbi:MAG: signal peptidase II [Armatimonadota bacterium]|nr:signal peptidase II [Armatimonadota bacterium]
MTPASGSEARRLTPVVYLTAAAILLADQAAKLAAVHLLKPVGTVPVLGPYLSLTWATNTGGAFGMLPTATSLLVATAAVVIAVLVLVAHRVSASPLLAVSVALLIGGALGNLIDRLRLGYVIDFIDLHFWPIFNIADIAITVGAGLLIIATIAGSASRRASHQEED